jgi:hypothetical protein
MNALLTNIRQSLGLALLDVPLSLARMVGPENWVLIGNRCDHRDIRRAPLRVQVNSPWSSEIVVLTRYAPLRHRLLRRILAQWPVDLATEPTFSSRPDISVVIPFRGRGRLPLLEAVVKSVGTQRDAAVECIVVEQSPIREVERLAGDPTIIHAPGLDGDDRWNKCLAFNVGVQAARGRILILQDGDIPLPKDYCRHVLRRMETERLDVLYPQRFLFYLDQLSTTQAISTGVLRGLRAEYVQQNWVGGTVVITPQAYWRIGGFDTRFTGWTGEDREFHDRTQVLTGSWHGYIPFVHLWHPHAPDRDQPALRACPEAYVHEIMSVPRERRIERLLGNKR